MKILSVKLKSIIIATVLLIVALLTLLTTSALAESVSGNTLLIPGYNVNTNANNIAVTFNYGINYR